MAFFFFCVQLYHEVLFGRIPKRADVCSACFFNDSVFHNWIPLGTFTQHKDFSCVILLLSSKPEISKASSSSFDYIIWKKKKTFFSSHFSFLMYGKHNIWTQFKSIGKGKATADHKTLKQHIGFDHLWALSTICVQQKMKMFVRSETLICSKCSLYEWISITGWIPHNALLHCAAKLIIWLTNVKALSYSRKQKTQFSPFHHSSWNKGSMRKNTFLSGGLGHHGRLILLLVTKFFHIEKWKRILPRKTHWSIL